MEIRKFSRALYKKEENNKPFIIAIAIIIAFVHNIFNTYYNKVLEDNEVFFKGTMHVYDSTTGGEMVEVYTTLGAEFRTNAFMVIFCVFALIIFITTLYIKEKSKHAACMFYSGGSYSQSLIFLLYNNLKSFGYIVIIGLSMGILISPAYNMIFYKILGKQGEMITIYPEGIIMMLSYLMITIITATLISWGNLYRKDIMGLLSEKDGKSMPDKRSKKIPWIIMVLIYLFPVIIFVLMPRDPNMHTVVNGGNYVSMLMLYLIIRYSVEDIFKWLKKKQFMYKKNRIIYVGNAIKTIKEAYPYIMIYLYCVTAASGYMGDIIQKKGAKENLAISLIGIAICVAVSLGYKLTIELIDIEKRSYQLRQIGFSDKEIIRCAKNEVLTVFAFTISIPTINLIVYILSHVVGQNFTAFYGMVVILGVAIPQIIIAMGVTSYFKRKIAMKLKRS